MGIKKIGTTGFEPATPTTPRWYATKLRYVPIIIIKFSNTSACLNQAATSLRNVTFSYVSHRQSVPIIIIKFSNTSACLNQAATSLRNVTFSYVSHRQSVPIYFILLFNDLFSTRSFYFLFTP